MCNKLPIRPKPINGECLTSFLLRVSAENQVSFYDLWRSVKTDYYKKLEFHIANQIDLAPECVFDLPALSELVGVSINDLKSMTFTFALERFPSSSQKGNSSRRSPLRLMLEQRKRRFCPVCLGDRKGYKLLWQVKEIKICDIHKTELNHQCPGCSAEQPYIRDESTLNALCHECGIFLGSGTKKDIINDDMVISEQVIRYADWRFLTLPYEKSTDVFQVNPVQRAIVALYLAQGKKDIFEREPLSFFRNYEVTSILQRIKAESNTPIITLSQLFHLIRSVGMEMHQFAKLRVPDTYVKSLYAYKDSETITTPGPCLAPWCRCYGTADEMKQVGGSLNTSLYMRERFYLPSVCMSCYLKYGYRSSNQEWAEMGDFIKLGWEEVLALLNQGVAPTTIAERLNVSTHRINRVAGYMMRHWLVNEHVIERFAPLKFPKELVAKFREMDRKFGEMSVIAKKEYGWSKLHYFFYRASPDVMRYLYFDWNKQKKAPIKKGTAKREWTKKIREHLKKCAEEEIEISIREVATSLDCSTILLYSYGLHQIINDARIRQENRSEKELWKRAMEYVYSKKVEKRFDPDGFYKSIGRTKGWVMKRFPEIVKWMSEQTERHSLEYMQQRYQELAAGVIDTVWEFYQMGMCITKKQVAEQLGIHPAMFKRVPALKKAFEDSISEIHSKWDG